MAFLKHVRAIFMLIACYRSKFIAYNTAVRGYSVVVK